MAALYILLFNKKNELICLQNILKKCIINLSKIANNIFEYFQINFGYY